MEYKLVEVINKDTLDLLYEESALTIEGLQLDSIDAFIQDIGQRAGYIHDSIEVYITKGKLMNEVYGLTDSNAYKDDLTIVSIKLSDIKDISSILLYRFSIGGRWFDDIVDNNYLRQKAISRSERGLN